MMFVMTFTTLGQKEKKMKKKKQSVFFQIQLHCLKKLHFARLIFNNYFLKLRRHVLNVAKP